MNMRGMMINQDLADITSNLNTDVLYHSSPACPTILLVSITSVAFDKIYGVETSNTTGEQLSQNITLWICYITPSVQNNGHPVARGDPNFCRMTKINEQVIRRMTSFWQIQSSHFWSTVVTFLQKYAWPKFLPDDVWLGRLVDGHDFFLISNTNYTILHKLIFCYTILFIFRHGGTFLNMTE